MHLIRITGYDQIKQEWLAQIESEQMRYFSLEETIKDIQIEGNYASFIECSTGGKYVLIESF